MYIEYRMILHHKPIGIENEKVLQDMDLKNPVFAMHCGSRKSWIIRQLKDLRVRVRVCVKVKVLCLEYELGLELGSGLGLGSGFR